MICTLLVMLAMLQKIYDGHDVLKKVNEMNFKLVLPSPMSMPVAAPHGPILLK